MIEGLIAGRLYCRPEQRTGKNGKPYVVAKVRAAAGDGDSVFINVVTFSQSTQSALLALGDGDAVLVAGTLTPKAWVDREGQARPELDMVAYQAERKREAASAFGDGPDTCLEGGNA